MWKLLHGQIVKLNCYLETVKGYASECHYKGVDWKSVKAKYEKITNFFYRAISEIKGWRALT